MRGSSGALYKRSAPARDPPFSEFSAPTPLTPTLSRKREREIGARSGEGLEGGASHQTFSISGRPSRPEGRKIRTTMRIEKAATSLYSTEK
jgi:hypothetical protein